MSTRVFTPFQITIAKQLGESFSGERKVVDYLKKKLVAYWKNLITKTPRITAKIPMDEFDRKSG